MWRVSPSDRTQFHLNVVCVVSDFVNNDFYSLVIFRTYACSSCRGNSISFIRMLLGLQVVVNGRRQQRILPTYRGFENMHVQQVTSQIYPLNPYLLNVTRWNLDLRCPDELYSCCYNETRTSGAQKSDTDVYILLFSLSVEETKILSNVLITSLI